MRVLVYGAGVIGCELAHELCKGENDVTLLARGKWKDTIDKKGLIIRHYVQLHTTVDFISTIDQLEPEDMFDLIFVVMQYGQLEEVLLPVARNISKRVILVGNNMDAKGCEETIKKNSVVKKEVAFGFQGTAGRREEEKVISIHTKSSMTIGGINGMSKEFVKTIKEVFRATGYQLKKEPNMDAWLKCHMAFILPICYLCYGLDGKLKRVRSKQISNVFDAVIEAHEMLKKLGYPIRPDGEEEYFLQGRKEHETMLFLMAKTPLGMLAAGDHAMHAVDEMKKLDKEFMKLKAEAGIQMPVWEKLRSEARKDWE